MQYIQRRSDGTRVLTEKLETKFIAGEEFELKGNVHVSAIELGQQHLRVGGTKRIGRVSESHQF